MPPKSWLDIFPFVTIMIIIALLIYYLYTYFDQIAKGQISSYYNGFSQLSTLFLAAQVIILFSAMFSGSGEITGKLLSDKTFSLLALFGVINFLIVLTLGVVLHFYSTQG
jgi:hypothetical protein